jgi:hypothetical protein
VLSLYERRAAVSRPVRRLGPGSVGWGGEGLGSARALALGRARPGLTAGGFAIRLRRRSRIRIGSPAESRASDDPDGAAR